MKKILLLLLSGVLTVSLAACGNSGDGDGGSTTPNIQTEGENVAFDPDSWEEKYGTLVNVDYDAILAALPELTEEEKNKVVEMGFRDCDHMVPGPIGEAAGIFESLGMQVNVTKTGQVYEAMSAGQMDLAYMGFSAGQVTAINNGAPFAIASGNHTGGSFYMVVSNEIETAEDLLGRQLSIGSSAFNTTAWREISAELGIPAETENYEVLNMSDQDEFFALQAGQLDGFTCCDPWASYAEYLGVGRIVATSWGAVSQETSGQHAGIHCVLGANTDFLEQYPNLATRLMYAHVLSVQYMYQHPYRSAEIFSEYFDVPVEVSLQTIWIKIINEGRSINWELSEGNFETWLHEYERWGIAEEDSPQVTMEELNNIWKPAAMNRAYECGVPDFQAFITEKVDPVFPLGLSFDEFLAIAKEIDGIED